MDWSTEAVAKLLEYLSQSQERTSFAWAARVRTDLLLRTSHTLTVWSPEADKRILGLRGDYLRGFHTAQYTMYVCSASVATALGALRSHTFTRRS